jgi:translocation and assembly module TamB
VPLDFRVRAQGPAARIAASAQLQVLQPGTDAADLPHATATAVVTPFAAMPVPSGQADFERLDLALFWPSAPGTLLSGHVEVKPQGKSDYALRADLRNERAGPWDAPRLPVSAARAEGEWRDGTALVRMLHAQVGGGTVEGEGAWKGTGWNFSGRIADVDPSQLHRSLAALPLSGPLEVKGEDRAVDFDVKLAAGTPRRNGRHADTLLADAQALDLRDLAAQGRWNDGTLSLAQLRVRTGDASLEGEGELRPAEVAGSGKLALRAPGLRADAQAQVAETRGHGQADIALTDLAQAQRWLARWPGLKKRIAGVDLRGAAQAQLAWQGGWRDPTVQLRASTDTLAWQGASGAAGAWTVRDASVQAQGRLRDAALQLHGQARQGQRSVTLAASGRFGGTLGKVPRWQGQVASLQVQWQDPAATPGPWDLQLRRPVGWQFAGGNFQLDAGEAALHAPALRSGAPASEALLAWSPVRRQGGELTTAGSLRGLPLSWLALFGGPQLAGSALSGDLVFDAQWNAVLGRTVRVDASLARVRGDVQVLAESVDGTSARVSAGVREARLTLRSDGAQLLLSLLWDSERAGHAEGAIRTRLAPTPEGGWTWPEDAPLAGRVQARLPRIGVWSLLAPPGWRLRGSLSADIAVAGTRAQPELSGPLAADDLALRSVVDGVELRNGRLRARLEGDRLRVDEFLLHGSEQGGGDGGSLLATGEGRWTPEGPLLEARATLQQLRASIRSDRQLTVSGEVSAHMDRTVTQVEGKLTVDRARIQVPDETPPRLGDDVVVHDAPGVAETETERRQRPAPPQGKRKLAVHVTIDLGPDFRVAGRGVDTRLAGSVQVEGASAGLPQLVGVIHAVGGTYRAYGENLAIERGELRFTGAADNPALDILAIRPNLTPKVGVQVTGRAQSPHVELYSDAGLSDVETLSYLVLGRSSAGGGTETALLQRAATAFLAGRRGNGKGLAGSLGLDDITVRSDSVAGPVVRVGKRFAQNFYAAYERSLSGAMGTLFIFYDVSRRVTLRAEAGERAGLDVIFTLSFDHVGGQRR